MKQITFSLLLIVMSIGVINAQQPFKGNFTKQSSTKTIDMAIDLMGRNLPGRTGLYYDENSGSYKVGDPEKIKSYGAIVISSEYHLDFYDIIRVGKIANGKATIYAVYENFFNEDSEPMVDCFELKMGVGNKSIILNDPVDSSGKYFNNLILKRTKNEPDTSGM